MTLSKKVLFLMLPLFVLGLVFASLSTLVLSPHFSIHEWGVELFSSATLAALFLTLRYSLLALGIAWILSHVIVRWFSARSVGMLRMLVILPGFAYALLTIYTLRLFQVQDRYSMLSVLIAWSLIGVPYLSVVLSEAKYDLDPRERDALRTLGARPWQMWWHHDFLRTLPTQGAALLQQFWLYLTSFSIVMILSGGPPNETLEVAIYTSVRLDRIQLNHALALAFWQGLVLIGVRSGLLRMPRAAGMQWRERVSFQSARMKRIKLGVILFLGVALLFSLRSSSEWFPVLLNSTFVSLFAVFGTLVFSLSCYFSGFRSIAELGAWFSPIVLSLGIWSGFGFVTPPLFNVALIQTILFAPWVARSVFPLLDRARRLELEAAATLGAPPFRAWKSIEWPRIRPVLMRVLSMVASFSLMEVTTVMLFSRGDFETLSSYTQNLFSRFRFQEAGWGFLLMLVMSIMILEWSEESRS